MKVILKFLGWSKDTRGKALDAEYTTISGTHAHTNTQTAVYNEHQINMQQAQNGTRLLQTKPG